MKRLWSVNYQKENELKPVYWWRLEYADEVYTLFPVEWRGDSILTDGRRWIFVVRGGNVEVVRDLLMDKELEIQYRTEKKDSLISHLGEIDTRGTYANWILQEDFVSSVTIEQKDIETAQIQKLELLQCTSLVFEAIAEKWVRWCVIGSRLTQFSELEFDKHANIKALKLSIEWLGRLKIIRTDERVTQKALEKYLIGSKHVSSQAFLL